MGQKELTEKICNLEYSPERVLAFEGNRYDNVAPVSAEVEKSEYIVIKRSKSELAENMDIFEIGGTLDNTYPGALVKADQHLVEGRPDPILAKRAPVDYSIDLPQKTEMFTVEDPTHSKVQKKISEIIAANLPQGIDYTKAEIQLKKSLVYDEKSLTLAMGCNIEYLKSKVNLDFDMLKKGKRSAYLVKYKQVYYSVTADKPESPGLAFQDDVTWEELEKKGVGNAHPPAFVNCVQYGRVIYVLFQSDLSQNDLKIKIDADIISSEDGKDGKGKVHGDGKVDHTDKTGNISCDIIMLGGNAKAFSFDMNQKNVEAKLSEIIKNGLVFNRENPAYPISYSVSFLKDGALAVVKGNTEYIVTTLEKYSNAELELIHTGAFVARFYVSWDEIVGFDQNGKAQYQHKEWKENGKNKTARWSTKIALGGNVRNINIMAQGNTGLVWDQWRTPLDKKNIALAPIIRAQISGTTLNQKGRLDNG